jgi:hypothetical protein
MPDTDTVTPAGPPVHREQATGFDSAPPVPSNEATDPPSADRSSGDIGRAEASAMDTSPMLRPTTVAETAGLFDPIACLDDRTRRSGRQSDSTDRGCFIQIQGVDQTLLIPLDSEIIHIGRGLGAGLHLNESSVSRRHAVIVQRPSGHRILDDRSLNGTFVNGRRVEQRDLHDGDVITLGRVALRYVSRASLPAAGELATDAPSTPGLTAARF